MPISDFEVERELGRGAFATVYRCRRKFDGKVYALKKVGVEANVDRYGDAAIQGQS